MNAAQRRGPCRDVPVGANSAWSTAPSGSDATRRGLHQPPHCRGHCRRTGARRYRVPGGIGAHRRRKGRWCGRSRRAGSRSGGPRPARARRAGGGGPRPGVRHGQGPIAPQRREAHRVRPGFGRIGHRVSDDCPLAGSGLRTVSRRSGLGLNGLTPNKTRRRLRLRDLSRRRALHRIRRLGALWGVQAATGSTIFSGIAACRGAVWDIAHGCPGGVGNGSQRPQETLVRPTREASAVPRAQQGSGNLTAP